jgi:hypothetical protein
VVLQAATLSIGVKVTAVPRLNVLARVPTDRSTTRHPLPIPRVRAARVPLLHRYYEMLRHPANLPAALRCASLGGTTPRACVRASTQTRRRSGAGSFKVWQPPDASDYREGVAGSPRFLDSPNAATPCSSTPAGPDAPCLVGVPMLPPGCQHRRLPRVIISRLNSTALLLAVYASSWPLRNPDARLASGCWLGSTGWDWLPTGLLRKVSEVTRPPFPNFPWRKPGRARDYSLFCLRNKL